MIVGAHAIAGGEHGSTRLVPTIPAGLERQADRRRQAALQAQASVAIRQQLKANGQVRDLALFDGGIDAKLRGCDLVKLRVSDVAPSGALRLRATVT